MTKFEQYQPTLAYQSTHAIETYQVNALKTQLSYMLTHNTYYKQLLERNQILIDDIQEVSDLYKLPLLSKAIVQENISSFTCINAINTAEIVATSGTLGSPLSIALSNNDLDRLVYNEWYSFQNIEITKNDVVQLTLTNDRQFMAGMAYYTGLKAIGATIIRIGPGVPQLQWDAILRYNTTVLVAVPSFLKKLIDYAIQHEIDYKNTAVTKVLMIGESIYDEYGKPTVILNTLKELWPIAYFNTYASTEMQTAFTECSAHQGMHINPSLMIAEVLSDEDIPLPYNQVGELCITNLGVEGVPLVRYKTGDITLIDNSPCTCGKNTPRIHGIIGRKNHLLKLRGTSVYPNAIFEALEACKTVKLYVVTAFKNELGLDDVCIEVSTTNNNNTDIISIQSWLQSKIKIKLNIMLANESSLLQKQFPPHSRKQIKFIDNRY